MSIRRIILLGSSAIMLATCFAPAQQDSTGGQARVSNDKGKEVKSSSRRTSDVPDDVLIVNSDPTDPAVPLDLSLVVRLFAKERLLEIRARVGKHPAFPAALFFDKDVKVQIQLPPGIELQKGKLSWQGDLRGDEIGEFQATVKAVRDLEGAVDARAIGHAEGRFDVDDERFYVLAKGRTVKISLAPFSKAVPSQPGKVAPSHPTDQQRR